MKPSRLSRALEYVPPVVAFAAAVGAIAGAPKWDSQAAGLAKITTLGWTLLGVGIAALVSSLLILNRNHREHKAQKVAREKIASVGQQEVLRGLDRVVVVFRNSTHWQARHPEPESPLDLLAPERRSALASIDLNAMSPYADGKGTVKWWAMFENTAKEGSAQISTAMQTYVTFLDPQVIEAATKLLNCEFLRIRLQHMHDIIDANTRGDPERPVRFSWVATDEKHSVGYEEFWHLVAQVIRLCAKAAPSGKVLWNST